MEKEITRNDVIRRIGINNLTKILNVQAEPTGRLIYPAFENVYRIGREEYIGGTHDNDVCTITVYYYIPRDEDIEIIDWEKYAIYKLEEKL